jgi:hypothetical protein
MILNRTNHLYAEGMIKWWPVIIILMGVEVLVYFSRKSENERIGFSFLIIPVILIFLFVNMYQGIGNKFKFNTDFNKGISFNNMIDYFRDIDSDRYKVISTSKSLEAKINTLTLNIDNADINIIKSNDGKTKLDLKIYVNKNESTNNYNIKDTINGDNANININENYIRKVSGDIYIAEFGSVTPRTYGNATAQYEGVGHRVSKINTFTGAVSTFAINKSGFSASITREGGFGRPSDIAFGPDGAMYVVDMGINEITDPNKFIPFTGVIWRITKI